MITVSWMRTRNNKMIITMLGEMSVNREVKVSDELIKGELMDEKMVVRVLEEQTEELQHDHEHEIVGEDDVTCRQMMMGEMIDEVMMEEILRLSLKSVVSAHVQRQIMIQLFGKVIKLEHYF